VDLIVTLSVNAGLAACFERSFAEVSFAFIKAKLKAEKSQGSVPKNTLMQTAAAPPAVFFHALKKSGAATFPGFDASCEALSRSIRENSTETIPELLYVFFEGFLEKELLYDLDLVELCCIELVDQVLEENADYIKIIPRDTLLALKKNITACTTVHEVFDAACGVLMSFCRNNEGIKSAGRLVRKTLAFIHEHYGENISLPQAAEALLISPNYLSRIFSFEMEETFSHYLLEYRIKQAKKLLKESNDKVYEVAEKTGYSDVIHFSKVFKKTTGLSPNQFRNKGKI
jgi:YesN/AraC family two-component response regulator